MVAYNTSVACWPKHGVHLTATNIPLEANTYAMNIPVESALDNLTSSNIVTFPGNLPGFTEGCAEGYTGFLCSNCEQGWTHSGNKCGRCPENPILSYVQLTLAVVFSLGLIIWMVRAALNYSQENANQVSILSKILVSYLQMTAVITSFKVDACFRVLENANPLFNIPPCAKVKWPDNFFGLGSLAEVSEASMDKGRLLSIECIVSYHLQQYNLHQFASEILQRSLFVFCVSILYFIGKPFAINPFVELVALQAPCFP